MEIEWDFLSTWLATIEWTRYLTRVAVVDDLHFRSVETHVGLLC